ncbi:hypothetical protein [Micromonospora sp. S-DT3-3-22]|nr:hypothetical protein [Micromonospora sp. S-DT3-3-22]
MAEYRNDRTALLLFLGALMTEASGQLHQLHPDRRLDLTERFMSWARAR